MSSLERQISQFQGHFENRLGKSEKNRIASSKCDICTLDIMIDFHWKHETNRWRSEICLVRSYADSLLKSPGFTCRVLLFSSQMRRSALLTSGWTVVRICFYKYNSVHIVNCHNGNLNQVHTSHWWDLLYLSFSRSCCSCFFASFSLHH